MQAKVENKIKWRRYSSLPNVMPMLRDGWFPLEWLSPGSPPLSYEDIEIGDISHKAHGNLCRKLSKMDVEFLKRKERDAPS